MIFINIIVYCNISHANQYISENLIVNKDKIILGTSNEIEKTTAEINKYLSLNNINNKNKFEKDINKDIYIKKPLVLETESRQEIEEDKLREKEASNYTYYDPSLYNYSRNTIARDRNESIDNSYYYGYCTWYVASKKEVPNFWGNAGNWLNGASQSGYETSNTAKSESIIVTSESGWGHVGVVKEVKENSIIISEMNYNGWGTINTREISKDSPQIKGYIY